MAFVDILLLFYVLVSVEGSEHRFVAPGSDLLLDVNRTKIDQGDDFSWRFNTTKNIVKFNSGSDPIVYENQAEFFKQNFSLLLRNVQHSNRGNYKAIAIGREEKTAAEYTVTVQDRVTRVNLTVIAIDHSICNFNVTCKTKDSKIYGTFYCENKACRLLDQTTFKESSLNISVNESSLICNHSNKVSWEQDVLNVTSLCTNKTETNTAVIVGISAAAIVLVGFVFIICKRKSTSNTVYEVPQNPRQHYEYANPAEITESTSPTSTYSLVQLPNPEVQLNETRTSTNTQPETIYAQVDRAAKSSSNPAAANR